MELTVFTPTYNRKDLLERCYRSIREQTYKDFVWLIVDDGSSDGTEETVRKWMKETSSPEIRYVYKENGGLHTAYNTAIENIGTPLCVCIDSDDWMPEDAVEKILSFWKENGSERFAGIVGLDCLEDGTVLGDALPGRTVNLIDILTGKTRVRFGDRTNVVRTELYRKYAPMKVFPGEKNFNPHYMHLQISQEYDFLVMNENLRFVEYQPDGMTASMYRQYLNSPRSFAETRLLYLSFPGTSFGFRFRHSVHLVSSCMLYGVPSDALRRSPCKGMALLAYPAGAVLSVWIRAKGGKNS